jgi:DNA end-binding protein Ku
LKALKIAQTETFPERFWSTQGGTMPSTIWRGFITFGLISVPVRLFRAARAERVSLRRLQRTPVSKSGGRVPAAPEEDLGESAEDASATAPGRLEPTLFRAPGRDKETAKAASEPIPFRRTPEPELRPVQQASIVAGERTSIVAPKDIVKGYEYEKNRFVALDPEELKSLERKTATEMEIQEFVNLAEIDPVYFETSYFVVPEEAGRKAYSLLYKALANSGLVAVSQLAMHGREHVVIVRPGKSGLVAHTMFYSSEVHADEEYRADVREVTDKELQLAETLIGSLSATFEPDKYRDHYREQLEEMIARKVEGKPVTEAPRPSTQSSVIDITEALQRSLAALKKPPSSDESKPKPAPRARKNTSRSAG